MDIRSILVHLDATSASLERHALAHALADRFDAEDGRMALEFTRNPASEVTEVKVSGGRVRNIRYTRVTLPKAL